MRRIEQVNEILKVKLANLIARELPIENGLITISYVDCSPDLRVAKIGISVLPFNQSGKALKKLRKHRSEFTNILKKEIHMRQIPKFHWVVDSTEKKASELEKIFMQIEKEREMEKEK
jgi:ribosome-binding factor A